MSDAKRIAELESVLRAYEQWEADLIMDNDSWRDRNLPLIKQSQWDRLMEIQTLRNAVLSATTP